MANMYWRGNSIAVAQVTDFTPGTGSGTLYSIVAYDDEGHSFPLVSVSPGTIQACVEALKAQADLRKAEGVGPWDEITATEDNAKLTLTSDVAGKPIYFTVSVTGDTLTETAVTANKGPYDWNDLANWDGDGDLPGEDTLDTVYIENAVIKYGLDQSGKTYALTALHISQSQIGQNSVDNLAPSYLQIKASELNVNYFNNPGSAAFLSPINIDLGSTQCTATIFNSPAASGAPAVNIKCNHASTKLHIVLGSVGVANNAGETTTVGEINVLGGACYVGAGVTLTTLLNRVGATLARCGMTTLTLDSGTVRTEGTGAIITVNINGGTATLSSAGTITNLNAIKGLADMSKTTVARTVTTAKIGSGGSIKYDPAVVTMTNKVQPYNATGEITLSAA